jgi:hypothetical protein
MCELVRRYKISHGYSFLRVTFSEGNESYFQGIFIKIKVRPSYARDERRYASSHGY